MVQPKQSNAKHAKAKQSKTKQGKAKQGKAKQGNARQVSSGLVQGWFKAVQGWFKAGPKLVRSNSGLAQGAPKVGPKQSKVG
jgi:hypothetical protein